MRRDLRELAARPYDVVVVGGGIYGAWIACDAARRGLRTALVERDDFGAATSGASLGIVHGGLRYLRHADVRRARQSVRERRALLRIAPHLVEPLPVLIPAYRGRAPGLARLTVALAANDLLSADRNRGVRPGWRIPRGRLVSRRECLERFPELDERGLTGGALFHDARMIRPHRLTLAVVLGSAEAGAAVANHAEATGLIVRAGRVEGVAVHDGVTGERLDLRARAVVNAAGPWAGRLLGGLRGGPPLARAMNIVVGRRLTAGCAAGVAGRDGRLLFVAPWADRSAIGTFYAPHRGDPDASRPLVADLERALADIGAALPSAGLGACDVRLVLAGLLPCDAEALGRAGAADEVRLATRHRIHDHAREDGVEGVVSVIGVKYTTARDVAEQVVDLLFRRMGRKPPPATTAARPLPGAAAEEPGRLAAGAVAARARELTPEALGWLRERYGARDAAVLALLDDEPAGTRPTAVLEAAARHAIRREMALTLGDVVRRTGLADAGLPDASALGVVSAVAARELGWDAERAACEVAAVTTRPGRPPPSSIEPRR